MALTKMSTSVTNIQNLSDLPNTTDGLTSSELKIRFDKAGMDLKSYLNGTLTEELDTKIRSIENQADNIANLVSFLQETMLSYSDIYPVGAIYISVNSTNPGTMFGGTWERIEDTFLLASGSTYANGTTGGSATHTLTVAEMPSHGHKISGGYQSGGAMGNDRLVFAQGLNGQGYYTNATGGIPFIANTGGSSAHNNMPPYLAVYVWKRIS